jgi:hypothetical protein
VRASQQMPQAQSSRDRLQAALAVKLMCSHAPQAVRLRGQAAAVIAKQQRLQEGELNLLQTASARGGGEWGGRSRRGSASFRGVDAAQVCSNVGLVAVDGVFECSFFPAARQKVSERR